MANGTAQRRQIASGWAMQVAGYSVVLIFAASILHRLFGLDTAIALNLYLLAFIGAAVAIALAAWALWRIWRKGYRGTGSSLVAIVLSGAILMWPISLLPTIQALPNINDVTTDTERPPQFIEIAKRRSPGSNPIDYPPEFAEPQVKAYPDLRTLFVQREAIETVSLVAQALKKLRMEVVREVPPESRNGTGYVEAIDRTLVLGFYDDVVVRVIANGRRGALVDVRSASRFGQHDLGANATRVRKVMTALVERIQATVPKKISGRKLRQRRNVRRRSNGG